MVDTDKSDRKETIFNKEWTQGPIVSNLLLLSWPMVLMETLFVASQVADMVWVGRLGPAAIAGVGIANIVVMLVMSMDLGLIIGVRALVARYVGAGDMEGANHIAAQALILSVTWGALMMTIGILLAGPIMGLFGLEADVVADGMAYMRVMFAGWIAMDVLVMGLYIIQSSGDTLRPLYIEALLRVIHVTLCPFLVLGLWVFPHDGRKRGGPEQYHLSGTRDSSRVMASSRREDPATPYPERFPPRPRYHLAYIENRRSRPRYAFAEVFR